jgi:hypothetical protein
MSDPYLSYRIKWVCFFISIFIPAIALGFVSFGVGFIAMLILAVVLLIVIVGPMILAAWAVWICWQVAWQLCQDIFDKKALSRSRDTTSAVRLHKAPGVILLRIVIFLYSPTAVDEVFMPLIGDWRKENFDALVRGEIWKARWINLRYVMSLVMAMGLTKAFSVIRRLAGR